MTPVYRNPSLDMKESATAAAPSAPKSSAESAAPASTPAKATSRASTTLLVGLDLGTNTSCLLAEPAGSKDISLSKIVPSIVGYAKDGLVEGIITNNAQVLFGEAAFAHRQQVNLVAPLENGIIAHREPARDFLQHLRDLTDASGNATLHAVIGVPANASVEAREDLCQAVTGLFDRVLLIPEPFLAALGYRDDSRLGQSEYVDPVVNSLIVDIGGGTTDLCLVQGYFPGPEDQVSIPHAGDAINRQLADLIERTYPNSGLSRHHIRQLKEAHAYVGPVRKPLEAEVIVGGKTRHIELGEAIGTVCNAFFDKLYVGVRQLIARAPSDAVATTLRNIIVTGGGAQMKGMDTVLQQRLTEDGYVNPKVRWAGVDYKRHVALGALKAARSTKENQWQQLIG